MTAFIGLLTAQERYARTVALLDPLAHGASTLSERANVTLERAMVGSRIRMRKRYKLDGRDAGPFSLQQQQMHEIDITSRWIRLMDRSGASGRATGTGVFVELDVFGIDLDDWEWLCRHATLDPFASPHAILALFRAVLVRMRAFHAAGFIHCDIKADNFCAPRLEGAESTRSRLPLWTTGNIDLERLTEIDLGFSYHKSVTPEFYGRIAPVDYISPHYKQLSQQILAHLSATGVTTRASEQAIKDLLKKQSWRQDCFSLGAMLEDLWQRASQHHCAQEWHNSRRGKRQTATYHPPNRANFGAAIDLIEDLVVVLRECDAVVGAHDILPDASESPHNTLIARIDAFLTTSGFAALSVGLPLVLPTELVADTNGGAPHRDETRAWVPPPQRSPAATPKVDSEKPSAGRHVDVEVRKKLVLLTRKVDAETAATPALDSAVHEKRGLLRTSVAVGEHFRDAPWAPEMVRIPAGSFIMGSPPGECGRHDSEGPQCRIHLAYPLAVGKFPVTFDEWDACVVPAKSGYRPSDDGWERGSRPVINVSWQDAQDYLLHLNARLGFAANDPFRYRLLSEAEWEYAARAGSSSAFSINGQCKGRISSSEANFNGKFTYNGSQKGPYRAKTIPVGSLNAANAWGLHDMHGNVWEWVEDCWNDTLSGTPSNGTARTSGCTETSLRVLRGGSWISGPLYLRAAGRSRVTAESRYDVIGFRVARTVDV